ncbi:hypothetical protein M7I_2163 [Glarea lozoyensis 74030]|uniref:Uncharacterized protein n=1 Tax=Glarea lozoyensis (strain ATCC 74030 / MF5533) TaxID=1104152 RepID=H0EI18_GLAL7|nr:hypothetical protein M7I_2163 [Glarea lozoyensis 74030]
MAPRNKGKKAAAAKAAKEAEESAQKAAAASSSASKSQKGIDKGVTLQVPTSSESITGTPAPTPTASVPKTSTSGFGRDSATGSTIELQEPQDEVPEEGYGSEDSADSAEIAAMFGSGGAPRADSFSEGDDGATLASPKDETPEPFEDTTPSYNSIQEIEFEPPISRKPKLKSLFVPLPSPPIPGQEDTSDVQIYDPETDGTVDGSVVRPRTPPLKRLATIAAAQKANAKARKEAGSNKPSLFVPAGKTDDDGNLGYLQAPLMVDGSDQMLAVDSAEEIAKLNAQAAVTQYVEVRNESLVADLGESISKELEQWRSYAKKAPKSEEAVKIANAAIEALQKSQLRLIGENLNLKLVTDVLQEETKKLTQTVNGALFQQAGVETEFAREHKMIQARNLKVIARLEEKIARLQNTEAHVLLKESERYAAHLKEIAEDYKRLQEQFLELKTQQDYVKASVQPQLKDNEELWVPEMEEEFAKLRSEKEKDELIIRQGTEISVLQKQQKEAEKKISAYAKSGNKPVGVRHRNEGSALGSPQSAVQTRSAAEGGVYSMTFLVMSR